MEINNYTTVDKSEVLAALSESVTAGGSQRSWCKTHGISPPYLSDVLNGRRDPGPKILDVLGLEPVTLYRPKTESKPT